MQMLTVQLDLSQCEKHFYKMTLDFGFIVPKTLLDYSINMQTTNL